jgi:hypothetical protein
MSNLEAVHSFLEERPTNRYELEDHICVRFIRKKFKCLIIFFLTICILGETLIMSFDKINFDKFDIILQKIFHNNDTHVSI